MISAGVEAKLLRIQEIAAQKAELDAELEQLLGGEPAEPVVVEQPMTSRREKAAGWSPASRPAADHPYRGGGRKAEYDKEAILDDIDAGVLKTKEIAEKHGVKVAVVYNVKSNGNRDRRTKPRAEVPREEAPARPATPASPAMKRDPITAEQFKEVKRLFHEGKKLTTEIAKITGLDGEEINVAVQAQAYGMYIFNRKRK